MVGAAGASATGAGAIIGLPVLFAAGAFYAYQVSDVAQSCGDAYVASAEQGFAAAYNVAGRRRMLTNYSDMICKSY